MSDEKIVQLKESELKKLIGEIEALKKAVHGTVTTKPEETKHRTLNLRFIDDKPIVGLHNRGSEKYPIYTHEKPDPMNPKENRLYIDVYLAGESKPTSLSYKALLEETEKYTVKILEVKEEPWHVDQGQVEAKEVDWDRYTTTSNGDTVPARVTGTKRTIIVEDPFNAGETITIPEEVANIG